MSRSLGQNLWYLVKGLIIRNAYVKYESCIYTGSEVMVKVKAFVHLHTNTYADTRGMTKALQKILAVH